MGMLREAFEGSRGMANPDPRKGKSSAETARANERIQSRAKRESALIDQVDLISELVESTTEGGINMDGTFKIEKEFTDDHRDLTALVDSLAEGLDESDQPTRIETVIASTTTVRLEGNPKDFTVWVAVFTTKAGTKSAASFINQKEGFYDYDYLIFDVV